MNNKLLRAAIYIRVSTAEQQIHGKSLQAQREFLEKYAKEHDMVIAGVYADEGKTARKELKKRKAIHSLLNVVKRQEIDIILFWKMDRWFRSVSDFYKVQDTLDESGVKWIAVAEPNMNMDTRDGRLNLNIMLSIGQNEVDTTSERIKFTNESIVNNGRLIFGDASLPFGYKTGIIDGEKQVVKDASKEEMVSEFFDYFLLRQNKSETIIHMQDMFGISFTRTMLNTMLSSELYIGKYRNNSNYCPAYLTKDTWDRVQEVSGRNIRIKKSVRVYLFAGLIKCPVCGWKLCSCGMSRSSTKGTKKSYSYYRCNKAAINHQCDFGKKISQNVVEKYLLDNLEQEYNAYVVRSTQSIKIEKKKRSVRTAEKIKKEMGNLNVMFQKERISFEYYDKEYIRLEKELKDVDNVAVEAHPNFEHIEKLIKINFVEMYNGLDLEGRQSFWHNFVKEIIIDEFGKIKQVDFF